MKTFETSSNRKPIESGKAVYREQTSGPDMWQAEPALDKALSDFRRSVHAWSKDAQSRPRRLNAGSPARRSRFAIAWAVGCVVALSAAGGGLYQHEHQKQLARIAQRDQQVRLAEKKAKEAEDLLARVDTDVSREVPDALEPLARLMSEDQSQ